MRPPGVAWGPSQRKRSEYEVRHECLAIFRSFRSAQGDVFVQLIGQLYDLGEAVMACPVAAEGSQGVNEGEADEEDDPCAKQMER